MLLTSDSTLVEGESCVPAAPEPGPEVPSVQWAAGTLEGLGSVGISGLYLPHRRDGKNWLRGVARD